MVNIWAWRSAPAQGDAVWAPSPSGASMQGSGVCTCRSTHTPASELCAGPRGPLPSGFPLGLADGSMAGIQGGKDKDVGGPRAPPSLLCLAAAAGSPLGLVPSGLGWSGVWRSLPAPTARLFLRCPPPPQGTALQMVFVQLPSIVPVGMDPLFLARPEVVVRVTVSSPWKQHGIKSQKSNGMGGPVCSSRPESGSWERPCCPAHRTLKMRREPSSRRRLPLARRFLTG